MGAEEDLQTSLLLHCETLELCIHVWGHSHRLTANAKYKMACHNLRLGLLPEAK